MKQVTIVTPARPGMRSGNLHTATRWAAMLRASGFAVRILQSWDGRPADALIALHAKRSHASVARWKDAHPAAPLIVTLTGTDLYRDLPRSAQARRSLELADRLIVLQDAAPKLLAARHRKKAAVVYQSSGTALRSAPPPRRFRVTVVGHLRDEKDPFRAVRAVSLIDDPAIEVVQLGGALDAAHDREARRWMRREKRYRWIGTQPHSRTLRWIAQSHVLVVSSRMEGGANVIAEAARIGTPVLASRMSGNLGMLGPRYPAYFRTGDHAALARLIARCMHGQVYQGIKGALAERRHLFAPAQERRALLGVVHAALKSRSASR
jgi:putative glycosyltransferase (TIGR04348 family)